MKQLVFVLIAVSLLSAGCAHLGVGAAEQQQRDLWEEAHRLYAEADYEGATARFESLVREYPDTRYGEEAHFHIGAIHLDPANPGWDPEVARTSLERYLALPPEPYRPQHHQWPEARVLHRLAEQLTMPAEDRVAALQPETRTEREVVRVVVPAEQSRALQAEVATLRQQLAEREAELERIRRTLTRERN